MFNVRVVNRHGYEIGVGEGFTLREAVANGDKIVQEHRDSFGDEKSGACVASGYWVKDEHPEFVSGYDFQSVPTKPDAVPGETGWELELFHGYPGYDNNREAVEKWMEAYGQYCHGMLNSDEVEVYPRERRLRGDIPVSSR